MKIGDTAPDFEAKTTEGRIRFHDWIGDSWAVLFSHPKDFTPGLHDRARIHGENKAAVRAEKCKDHRIVGRFDGRSSRDGRRTSKRLKVMRQITQSSAMPISTSRNSTGCSRPILQGDAKSRKPADNATVRNVYVIGPDKKIKLILVYPMTTGRNFDEVLRVIDSLQLTAKHQVATPVNWLPGEDVIIAGSVSDEEAKRRYPQGWKAPKPYLRIVPQPQ